MFKNRTLLEKLKNKHPYLLDELPATVRVDGIEMPLESAPWTRSPSPSSPSKTRSGPSAAA